MSGTRVTCEDVDSGESESCEIEDDYVIVTDGKVEISHVQTFANGTVQITLKRAK